METGTVVMIILIVLILIMGGINTYAWLNRDTKVACESGFRCLARCPDNPCPSGQSCLPNFSSALSQVNFRSGINLKMYKLSGNVNIAPAIYDGISFTLNFDDINFLRPSGITDNVGVVMTGYLKVPAGKHTFDINYIDDMGIMIITRPDGTNIIRSARCCGTSYTKDAQGPITFDTEEYCKLEIYFQQYGGAAKLVIHMDGAPIPSSMLWRQVE